MSEENKCSCGCEHDHEHEMEEMETMTLTLDDDTELNCGIIGVFEVDGIEYIALLPEDDDTVLIQQYNEDGEEVELSLIEDDDTFEKVSQAFDVLWEDEDEE